MFCSCLGLGILSWAGNMKFLGTSPSPYPKPITPVLTQRLRHSSKRGRGGVTQVSRSLQVLLVEHIQTVIKSSLVTFKTHPESDRHSPPPPLPPRSRPPQPLPGSQHCASLSPSSCLFPPSRNESIGGWRHRLLSSRGCSQSRGCDKGLGAGGGLGREGRGVKQQCVVVVAAVRGTGVPFCWISPATCRLLPWIVPSQGWDTGPFFHGLCPY